jgi:hypothetical protein
MFDNPCFSEQILLKERNFSIYSGEKTQKLQMNQSDSNGLFSKKWVQYPAPWCVTLGGVGDLFPHIGKDFKEKSSIPRRRAAKLDPHFSLVYAILPEKPKTLGRGIWHKRNVSI